ncbi:MAG: DUF503 domain-containing protein [Phycisphaerae bacterium]
MIVGVLTVELAIFDAQSLKDKRRVVASLKQKLRDRFNVSVAEVGYMDAPKRCRLGVVLVSRESRPVHSQLDKVVELVRRTGGLSLLDYKRELL